MPVTDMVVLDGDPRDLGEAHLGLVHLHAEVVRRERVVLLLEVRREGHRAMLYASSIWMESAMSSIVSMAASFEFAVKLGASSFVGKALSTFQLMTASPFSSQRRT